MKNCDFEISSARPRRLLRVSKYNYLPAYTDFTARCVYGFIVLYDTRTADLGVSRRCVRIRIALYEINYSDQEECLEAKLNGHINSRQAPLVVV